MKVTILLNGKSRTYNADEIDVRCFVDGENENDPNAGSTYMMGETLEGYLSIVGEIPIVVSGGEAEENQIILDQPIPENA
jgi:hypothetical protein